MAALASSPHPSTIRLRGIAVDALQILQRICRHHYLHRRPFLLNLFIFLIHVPSSSPRITDNYRQAFLQLRSTLKNPRVSICQ